MNQRLGLISLIIGIGLTAGFGSKLSPEVRAALVDDGQQVMAQNAVDARFAQYCATRSNEGAGDGDGCGDSPSLGDTPEVVLGQLMATSEILNIKATQARVEYRLALKRLVDLQRTSGSQNTQGPLARLRAWFSVGGGGFLAGWLLLLVGGWMCRRAVDSTAVAPASDDDAIDFGTLLGKVHDSVAALHTQMLTISAPSVADAEECKRRLEAIQVDALARLCGSGPRVHARHGIQGMAALFSPLSAGERKLNRAWAALVDRHWPEAVRSIGEAEQDLSETRGALDALL